MHPRSNNPTVLHCIIYQKALFCKILSQKMKEVTGTFIWNMNATVRTTHQFKAFLQNMAMMSNTRQRDGRAEV